MQWQGPSRCAFRSKVTTLVWHVVSSMFPFRNTRSQSVFRGKEADEASYRYWRNKAAACSTGAARFGIKAPVHKHTIASQNERCLNKISGTFLKRAACALTISAGRLWPLWQTRANFCSMEQHTDSLRWFQRQDYTQGSALSPAQMWRASIKSIWGMFGPTGLQHIFASQYQCSHIRFSQTFRKLRRHQVMLYLPSKLGWSWLWISSTRWNIPVPDQLIPPDMSKLIGKSKEKHKQKGLCCLTSKAVVMKLKFQATNKKWWRILLALNTNRVSH